MASERLFSALSYAVFIAPGVVVVAWVVWRVIAWGLFRTRAFAPNTSATLSHVFLFCVALPLLFVPMRYLADRIEGPQIQVWHWLLVLGSLAAAVTWLVVRLRRKPDWRRSL